MKKFLSLLAITSTILFSCSKEKTTVPVSSAPQRMTELKFTTSSMTMTYDNDGRILTMHRDQSPYVYDLEYSYAPGKAFHKTYYQGKVSLEGEYTLVNGKAIAHDWQEFNTDGSVLFTFHDKFIYSAGGQLEKRIYTNGAYWLYTFNSDGDIIKAVYYDENGQITTRTEFEYWDTLNKFPYLSDSNNYGELFFVPAYSKHMRKIFRSFDMPGDIKTYESKYEYQFNAAGYPVQTNGFDLFPASNQWSFTSKFQ